MEVVIVSLLMRSVTEYKAIGKTVAVIGQDALLNSLFIADC